MPITPSDCSKAGEFVQFLERIGFHDMATAFDAQWNEQVGRQTDAEGTSSSTEESMELRSSRKVSGDSRAEIMPRLLWMKHMVVSCEGEPSHVYSSSERKAPLFSHGAGYALHDYLGVMSEPVSMTAHSPYVRESPPSHLPIDTLPLRVVFQKGKTGLEPQAEFPIIEGDLIAGRYRVIKFIDSAAFSSAVRCTDEKEKRDVCLKIISNSKENFDQSLGEIQSLLAVNDRKEGSVSHIVHMYDYFYFKEHLFIVTELLLSNLYAYGKVIRERKLPSYFSLARIQSIAKQVLTAFQFLHSKSLLHCDVKPENILFKSYKTCEVRLIDLGSSCYITDSLSSYVQSRNYRSPEVILGCKYDAGIDIWSLGALLPELATGVLLFNNESVTTLLASMTAVCGPISGEMLRSGRNTPLFVTKHGVFYEMIGGQTIFHFPAAEKVKKSSLYGFNDADYVDFIDACLTIDFRQRPSATSLLLHPFITKDYGSPLCSSAIDEIIFR